MKVGVSFLYGYKDFFGIESEVIAFINDTQIKALYTFIARASDEFRM